MATTKGSNPNDDMKYVRNNLYGYGYNETTYIAPQKTLNDIEIDLDVINDINEVQSADIFVLKAQVETLLATYLTQADANLLFGVNLSYDNLTGELRLINGNGEAIGEAVVIIGGGGGSGVMRVDSITLVNEDDHGNEGLFLKFDYSIADDEGTVETFTVYSDFGSLLTLYTAGDGVAIDSGRTISVKFADDAEQFFTVTPDGISASGLSSTISGIEDSIDAIEEKVSHIEQGEGLVTTNEGEAAFGNYNVSTSGETLFSIGNGTDDEHRSNAFEVKADGSVWMMVEGEYLNINELLSMLAHETYN